MISINWGNQSRIQLLQKLVDINSYKTYLEIGCDSNVVFDNIKISVKEGVDPVRGGTLRITSDEFFSYDDRKWDLIFIDGLHEYNQVSRDVENALQRLADNGSIVIHDMLPTNEQQAYLTWTVSEWLGDVWRLGFDLMERSDIKFNIFKFDYGCGIITNGSQTPIILDKSEKWEFYENNYNKLPLVSFEQYFG